MLRSLVHAAKRWFREPQPEASPSSPLPQSAGADNTMASQARATAPRATGADAGDEHDDAVELHLDEGVNNFLDNVIAGNTDKLRQRLATQKLQSIVAARDNPRTNADASEVPERQSKVSAAKDGVTQYISSAARSLREYELVAYLGSGTFAEVTLARHRVTGNLFAVKKISKQKVKEEGCVQRTFTERQLLASFRHPFLVRLYQAFQSRTHLYLVLDFAQGGDLYYFAQKSVWVKDMQRALRRQSYVYYRRRPTTASSRRARREGWISPERHFGSARPSLRRLSQSFGGYSSITPDLFDCGFDATAAGRQRRGTHRFSQHTSSPISPRMAAQARRRAVDDHVSRRGAGHDALPRRDLEDSGGEVAGAADAPEASPTSRSDHILSDPRAQDGSPTFGALDQLANMSLVGNLSYYSNCSATDLANATFGDSSMVGEDVRQAAMRCGLVDARGVPSPGAAEALSCLQEQPSAANLGGGTSAPAEVNRGDAAASPNDTPSRSPHARDSTAIKEKKSSSEEDLASASRTLPMVAAAELRTDSSEATLAASDATATPHRNGLSSTLATSPASASQRLKRVIQRRKAAYARMHNAADDSDDENDCGDGDDTDRDDVRGKTDGGAIADADAAARAEPPRSRSPRPPPHVSGVQPTPSLRSPARSRRAMRRQPTHIADAPQYRDQTSASSFAPGRSTELDSLLQTPTTMTERSRPSPSHTRARRHRSEPGAANLAPCGMKDSVVQLPPLAPDVSRFPLRLIAFYAIELGLVLQYLHREGFVYRDLKPENILMRRDGHVMLTDFGVAKFRKGAMIGRMAAVQSDLQQQQQQQPPVPPQETTKPPRATSFTGTTQYMSPEILRGLPHDSRTDWWSYGCLLFEWANGRKAFAGANQLALFRSIVEDDVRVDDAADFRLTALELHLRVSQLHYRQQVLVNLEGWQRLRRSAEETTEEPHVLSAPSSANTSFAPHELAASRDPTSGMAPLSARTARRTPRTAHAGGYLHPDGSPARPGESPRPPPQQHTSSTLAHSFDHRHSEVGQPCSMPAESLRNLSFEYAPSNSATNTSFRALVTTPTHQSPLTPFTRDLYLRCAVDEMEEAARLLRDLIERLLVRDMEKRLSGPAVLEHPFFTCSYVASQLYGDYNGIKAVEELTQVPSASHADGDVESSSCWPLSRTSERVPSLASSPGKDAAQEAPTRRTSSSSAPHPVPAGDDAAPSTPPGLVPESFVHHLPCIRRPEEWAQLFLQQDIRPLYKPHLRAPDDLRYFPSAVTATGLNAEVEQQKQLRAAKEKQRMARQAAFMRRELMGETARSALEYPLEYPLGLLPRGRSSPAVLPLSPLEEKPSPRRVFGTPHRVAHANTTESLHITTPTSELLDDEAADAANRPSSSQRRHHRSSASTEHTERDRLHDTADHDDDDDDDGSTAAHAREAVPPSRSGFDARDDSPPEQPLPSFRAELKAGHKPVSEEDSPRSTLLARTAILPQSFVEAALAGSDADTEEAAPAAGSYYECDATEDTAESPAPSSAAARLSTAPTAAGAASSATVVVPPTDAAVLYAAAAGREATEDSTAGEEHAVPHRARRSIADTLSPAQSDSMTMAAANSAHALTEDDVLHASVKRASSAEEEEDDEADGDLGADDQSGRSSSQLAETNVSSSVDYDSSTVSEYDLTALSLAAASMSLGIPPPPALARAASDNDLNGLGGGAAAATSADAITGPFAHGDTGVDLAAAPVLTSAEHYTPLNTLWGVAYDVEDELPKPSLTADGVSQRAHWASDSRPPVRSVASGGDSSTASARRARRFNANIVRSSTGIPVVSRGQAAATAAGRGPCQYPCISESLHASASSSAPPQQAITSTIDQLASHATVAPSEAPAAAASHRDGTRDLRRSFRAASHSTHGSPNTVMVPLSSPEQLPASSHAMSPLWQNTASDSFVGNATSGDDYLHYTYDGRAGAAYLNSELDSGSPDGGGVPTSSDAGWSRSSSPHEAAAERLSSAHNSSQNFDHFQNFSFTSPQFANYYHERAPRSAEGPAKDVDAI